MCKNEAETDKIHCWLLIHYLFQFRDNSQHCQCNKGLIRVYDFNVHFVDINTSNINLGTLVFS